MSRPPESGCGSSCSCSRTAASPSGSCGGPRGPAAARWSSPSTRRCSGGATATVRNGFVDLPAGLACENLRDSPTGRAPADRLGPGPDLGGPGLAVRPHAAAGAGSRGSCTPTTPGSRSSTASAGSSSPTTAAASSTARWPPWTRCTAVVDAVAGRVPVILDGGVRRGTDVVTALALGAAAVRHRAAGDLGARGRRAGRRAARPGAVARRAGPGDGTVRRGPGRRDRSRPDRHLPVPPMRSVPRLLIRLRERLFALINGEEGSPCPARSWAPNTSSGSTPTPQPTAAAGAPACPTCSGTGSRPARRCTRSTWSPASATAPWPAPPAGSSRCRSSTRTTWPGRPRGACSTPCRPAGPAWCGCAT